MYGRVADADTNESVYVFVFDSFDLKTEVNIDCMFSINRMARNLHVFDPTPARTCSVVIPALGRGAEATMQFTVVVVSSV